MKKLLLLVAVVTLNAQASEVEQVMDREKGLEKLPNMLKQAVKAKHEARDGYKKTREEVAAALSLFDDSAKTSEQDEDVLDRDFFELIKAQNGNVAAHRVYVNASKAYKNLKSQEVCLVASSSLVVS